MKLKLTKTALDQVPPPPSGRINVHDTTTAGLCLQITAKDVRTFYVVRWCNGKMKWVRIGPMMRNTLDGGLTVEQARGMVKGVNGRLAAGDDPNAEKRAVREAASLGELWNRYLETYAKPHKKASSVAEDSRNWRKHLEPWGTGRRAAQITQADVKLLHTRIGDKSGKYAANRVLMLLSAMFTKTGKDLNIDPRDNPVRGVPRFEEKERDRVLDADEIQRFFNAVESDVDSDMRDFLLVALYTGARRSNVLAMKWENVNIRRGTWKIPGETSKNGDPLVVALAPPVLEILKKRPDDSPYVFPAKRVTPEQLSAVKDCAEKGLTTREIAKQVGLSQTQVCRMMRQDFDAITPRPMSPPKKAWTRILSTAKIAERTTLHDLRRTFATWMIRSGASLTVVAAAMGHKDIRTTQKHYAWADMDLVKSATLAGVQAIRHAAGIESTPQAVAG